MGGSDLVATKVGWGRDIFSEMEILYDTEKHVEMVIVACSCLDKWIRGKWIRITVVDVYFWKCFGCLALINE